MIRLLFAILLAVTSPTVVAESLTADEQRMVDWIDAHTVEAIALLKETVDIPSGTLNLQGVRDVGVVMRRELDSLGLKTEWVEMPAEMNRAGHLFGRKNGDGKKFLLIGHLDTVFEIEDGVRPYTSDGDIAHGHGVSDMKSGNVAIIYALRALKEIGALDAIPISVAFTGDEEDSGSPLSISRKDLIDEGKWADIALGFEEAVHYDGTDWATVARRSSSAWRLTVEGRQAHSSSIFNESTGAGAIFEASRILNAFYENVRGPEYLTFNAGMIAGGTEVDSEAGQGRANVFGKSNVVPRTLVVEGGIRTISIEQLEWARAAMQAIVAENLPHTRASITFADGYPPMSPTEGNLALQRALSDINVALGRNPMPALDPLRRGAADISFVAPYTDALAGLGAIGARGHTPDEYLELSSLPLAIKRAAILIYRLSRQEATD